MDYFGPLFDLTPHDYCDHVIGPYTNAALEICKELHFIPINTWKRHAHTQHEKHRIDASEYRDVALGKIQHARLITWIRPDGHQLRQFGYMLINRMYRNTARRAWAVRGRGRNMAQQRHHTAIRMDITLKRLRNYYKPILLENGKHLTYYLLKLRADP